MTRKHSSQTAILSGAFRRAGLSAALVSLLLAGGVSPVSSQEEGQPAWKRIADKISRNSLEESSPEELPGIVEPSDPGAAAANAPSAEAGAGAAAPAGPEGGVIVDAVTGEVLSGGRPTEETSLVPEVNTMTTAAPGTIGLPQAGGARGRGDARINLGKESEDQGTTVDLFRDPEVRRMLGDNPRFIYGAVESPDPMVFPPVRNAAIYAELTRDAEALIKRGKLAEAQLKYKRILDLNDKRYIMEMRNKIAELNSRMGAQKMVLDESQMINVQLPQWVRTNTRGILYEESDPMVLVGDFMLRVGDPVPSHPEVRVENITKRQVTYRVSDRKSFNVAVKGFQ